MCGPDPSCSQYQLIPFLVVILDLVRIMTGLKSSKRLRVWQKCSLIERPKCYKMITFRVTTFRLSRKRRDILLLQNQIVRKSRKQSKLIPQSYIIKLRICHPGFSIGEVFGLLGLRPLSQSTSPNPHISTSPQSPHLRISTRSPLSHCPHSIKRPELRCLRRSEDFLEGKTI